MVSALIKARLHTREARLLSKEARLLAEEAQLFREKARLPSQTTIAWPIEFCRRPQTFSALCATESRAFSRKSCASPPKSRASSERRRALFHCLHRGVATSLREGAPFVREVAPSVQTKRKKACLFCLKARLQCTEHEKSRAFFPRSRAFSAHNTKKSWTSHKLRKKSGCESISLSFNFSFSL